MHPMFVLRCLRPLCLCALLGFGLLQGCGTPVVCVDNIECEGENQICRNGNCEEREDKPKRRPPPIPDNTSSECQDGHIRRCYSGPENTAGKGVCNWGEQSCKDGAWAECRGEKKPSAELCDQKDNDCDGKVDEDNVCGECKPKETKACYEGPSGTAGIGLCKEGVKTCGADGRWSACQNAVGPVPETCNNKDDDCDGQADENGVCGSCKPGENRSCYDGPAGTEGKGICKAGTQTCKSNSQWGPCSGTLTPQKETCNSKDDNCDGKIDENGVCGSCRPQQKRNCYNGPAGTEGKGICKAGTQTCTNKFEWGPCQGVVTPKVETCNSKDDNCDGKTDENNICGDCVTGTKRSCYSGPKGTSGKGQCKTGTQTCNTAKKWGPCQGDVGPSQEDCNGKDDDCDGKTDEDLKPAPCSLFSGVCKMSVKRCGGTKGWLKCTDSDYLKQNSAYQAVETKCDGLDNDCDGRVDESLVRACYTGSQGCVASGFSYRCKGPCQAGQQTCSGGRWSSCAGERKPQTETCDNKDEDCDGQIDNGNPGGGKACKVSGAQGVCADGQTQCVSGRVSCRQTIQPTQENCSNGKDDNCDGKIDNCGVCVSGQTRPCYTGKTGCTKVGSRYQCTGACRSGVQRCVSGAWGSCSGQAIPQPEQCNWSDDNCDGKVDDAGACLYSTWRTRSMPSGAQHAAFLNPQVGVAVGISGRMWRSTDGGQRWTTLTSPTSQTLNQVYAEDSGLVIAVGNGGVIVRSIDGGQSFRLINTPLSQPLYDVIVGKDRKAMAVGARGTILLSSDAGATWSNVSRGDNNTFYGVAFPSTSRSTTIVVVGSGGLILRSTNSGSNWTQINNGLTQNNTATLYAVRWQQSSGLIVGAGGIVLRSTNSGSTWTPQSGFPDKVDLKILRSPGSGVFIAGSDTNFYLSTDSGVNFARRSFSIAGPYKDLVLRSPTALLALNSGKASEGEGPIRWQGDIPKETFRGIAFNNGYGGSTALAVSESGRIFRSTNSGSSWLQIPFSNTARLYGVGLYGNTAVAVGASGLILQSADGGRTWTKRSSGTTNTLYGVTLHTELGKVFALAVGSRKTLLRSSDGGVTWQNLSAPSAPSSFSSLYAVSVKGNTAIATGSSGWLIRSTNYGKTWTKQLSGTTSSLYGIYLYDSFSSSGAVAVGTSGTLLYSRDAGQTWKRATAPSGVTRTLRAVSIAYGSSILAAGDAGTIISSTDYGQTWTKIDGLPYVTYYGLYRNYATSNHIAAGSYGILLRTSDRNGKAGTWQPTRFPSVQLRGAHAISSTQYVTVSAQGLILHSSNSGSAWSLASVPSNNGLYDITHNGSTSLAVGANGAIIRSTDSGKTWTKITPPASVNTRSFYTTASPQRGQFLVAGSTGTILSSSDNGLSFSIRQSSGSNIWKLACNGSTCLGTGSSGTIMRSTNRGVSWSKVTSSVTNTLYGVAMGSSTEAVSVGSSGTVLYSTNGGASWNKASRPTFSTLYAVRAIQRGRYLALDSSGRVLTSGDGGKSWHLYAPPVGKSLRSLSFFGSTRGFIVGDDAATLQFQP